MWSPEGRTCIAKNKYFESNPQYPFVILSGAKDLALTYSYEILRSLRSLRMTKAGTFTEVSNRYEIPGVWGGNGALFEKGGPCPLRGLRGLASWRWGVGA